MPKKYKKKNWVKTHRFSITIGGHKVYEKKTRER